MPSTSKPCHNCRRRRLRCDRSWPTCHKCAVSGQECLGYGKVFVWTTQAIDSHGNLKPTQSSRHATDPHVSAASSTATSPIMMSSSDTTPPPSNLHQGHAQPLMQTNESMCPALSPEPGTASAMVLTDPVFQDLDRTSRSYLAYCKLVFTLSSRHPLPQPPLCLVFVGSMYPDSNSLVPT